MAGHNPSPLHMDPALLKYASMSAARANFFRWTGRTAGITFAYVIAFPAFIGYWAYTTEGKWDFRGKRRGDTISEF